MFFSLLGTLVICYTSNSSRIFTKNILNQIFVHFYICFSKFTASILFTNVNNDWNTLFYFSRVSMGRDLFIFHYSPGLLLLNKICYLFSYILLRGWGAVSKSSWCLYTARECIKMSNDRIYLLDRNTFHRMEEISPLVLYPPPHSVFNPSTILSSNAVHIRWWRANLQQGCKVII